MFVMILYVVFILPFSTLPITESRAEGEPVRVWYSGEDSENNAGDAPFKLSRQSDLVVESYEPTFTTIMHMDTSIVYQSHLGFGIAMDETACYFLGMLGEEQRRHVMNAFFNPDTGSGINMLRLCIGSSDLTTREFYSYNDMPEGSTDPQLEHFSIQKDVDYNIIARVKEAMAINPGIRVFASPWSPPGWMKSSGSMVGGKLKSEYYGVFAEYLVKFIEAYRDQGIDIYAVTPQNEPDYVPSNYPGCRYTPQEQIAVVKEIRERFDAHNIDAKIWILDHNYNLWDTFAKAVLDDETAKAAVDGIAFHPYLGTVDAMSKLHAAHPDKSIHFTEKSRKEIDDADKIIQDFRNWAESATMWASIGDGNGTGCAHHKFTHCPVIVKSETDYILGDEVFIFGHFARFIHNGARRIESEYGSKETVTNVCYRNPDESLVAVVCNQTSEQQNFELAYGDAMISSSLPPLTLATLQWTPESTENVSNGVQETPKFINADIESNRLTVRVSAGFRANRRVSVEIYNARGENLLRRHIPTNRAEWSCDLSSSGAGVFLTRIRLNGKQWYRGVVVVD